MVAGDRYVVVGVSSSLSGNGNHLPFLAVRDGGRRHSAPITDAIDHWKVLAHVRMDDGVDDELSGELTLFGAHVPEDVCVGVPEVPVASLMSRELGV